MIYNNIEKGIFISRPNRFVGNVMIGGQCVVCHIKNTGRCRELLVEGATVYLEDHSKNMGNRKLRYSLVSVEKKSQDGSVKLFNIDSMAPNTVVKEALLAGQVNIGSFCHKKMKITMERTFGDSRFDIFLEQDSNKAFVEVKGVTLEEKGVSMFPDAPTERGLKHIKGLIEAKKEGYDAFVIFLLQMENMREFRPNDSMHPEFGEALREAKNFGVVPLAFDCKVTKDSLHISRKVEIKLYNI